MGKYTYASTTAPIAVESKDKNTQISPEEVNNFQDPPLPNDQLSHTNQLASVDLTSTLRTEDEDKILEFTPEETPSTLQQIITEAQESIAQRLDSLITALDLEKIGNLRNKLRRSVYIPLIIMGALAASPSSGDAQTITHTFGVGAHTSFTDRVNTQDRDIDGWQASYRHDRQGDYSPIGTTRGVSYTQAAHAEYPNAYWTASMVSGSVGAYSSVVNARSTGDYYPYGISTTIGGEIGAGWKVTTSQTPFSQGEITQGERTIFTTLYGKLRWYTDADMTIETGPYATIFRQDNLDGWIQDNTFLGKDRIIGWTFQLGLVQQN